MMIVFTCSNVFATDIYQNIKSNANVDVSGITEMGSKILTVISTVGIVLSVIVLAILGIKYMMGSTEEKAEYKKTMIPYLVGAVLIFGASTIAQMVYNFTKM